jgi:UDP-galactopyranose mutase
MTRADYVIVGSGLTGAVLARLLTDAGRDVVVVDRRTHSGGNVHDQRHPSGVRIHTYGPHYFRTNSDRLWEFVTRFSDFYPYEARLKTFVDSKFESWPVTSSYIRRTVGDNWQPEFRGTPANFEEASLSMMPRLIYEKFVREYSRKQWGVDPQRLAPDLARRFDVREDNETRLSRHKYQGIPEHGYAHFMRQLLKGIPLVLDCDYLKHRGAFEHRRRLIFTGPIDEFFGFDQGKLMYRGQKREHEYHADREWMQPCGQVNFPCPNDGPHIRAMEWKHMVPPEERNAIRGTVVTRETTMTPTDPNQYEYPFPDQANSLLYAQYRNRLPALPDVLVCGRLGEYRYFDMDQAIARAFVLAKREFDVLVPDLEELLPARAAS